MQQPTEKPLKCVCIVVFPDYRAIVPYSMLSGLTSVAFSCERCWGRWFQSHRRITLALHPTHSLLHLQRRREEREEQKEGGREREEKGEEQGWKVDDGQ